MDVNPANPLLRPAMFGPNRGQALVSMVPRWWWKHIYEVVPSILWHAYLVLLELGTGMIVTRSRPPICKGDKSEGFALCCRHVVARLVPPAST